MFRNALLAATAAALITLLSATEAHAWGAAHVGYTHVGPSGVYHYGATDVRTPYGAYGGAHAGAYGYGGATYHAGYGAAAGYHPYTGAAYGGYRYGTAGGYAGGVYRGW
jgi:hypothetical protein